MDVASSEPTVTTFSSSELCKVYDWSHFMHPYSLSHCLETRSTVCYSCRSSPHPSAPTTWICTTIHNQCIHSFSRTFLTRIVSVLKHFQNFSILQSRIFSSHQLFDSHLHVLLYEPWSTIYTLYTLEFHNIEFVSLFHCALSLRSIGPLGLALLHTAYFCTPVI